MGDRVKETGEESGKKRPHFIEEKSYPSVFRPRCTIQEECEQEKEKIKDGRRESNFSKRTALAWIESSFLSLNLKIPKG